MPASDRIAPALGPIGTGHDGKLESALPFQIEIADVEREGRLDPLVNRLKEEAHEFVDEAVDRSLLQIGSHLGDDLLDLVGQKLFPGEEVEAAVEDREGHQFVLTALVLGQL